MIERRILFIVEGEQDELKFLKRMIKTCYPSIKHEFYSYKTTLHTLAQVLEKDYPSFEEDNIDIRLVLRSMENDKDKKLILSQKYNDIYLVFDFEPQHDNVHGLVVKFSGHDNELSAALHCQSGCPSLRS